jgi:hypothetical protein
VTLGSFQGGPNTTRLVITRLERILPDEAFRQPVDAMTASEAGQLIAWGLPGGKSVRRQQL